MTATSTIASFIRRNITVILAVPPVVALGFGMYAKLIRPKAQKSASPTATELTQNTEQLAES